MAAPRHLGPEPDDFAAAVDDALRPVLLLAARASAKATQRVSTSQLQALLVLQERGPMNLTSLAQELGAIPSSATRLCDRLVAADLITRETGAADRREVFLQLTTSGRRIVRQVRELRREGLREALEHSTSRERRELLSGLRALALRLSATEADARGTATGYLP
ncbi:MAG: MarR family transcriptional regulator [Frankiales bacterium]|jgi:DNA-binding MarR family transcriptional regulator|nr:MarR family transcriptional regulator [Frankiales bacterium]MCW2707937.1 MarR family transcriptional regulator [Frankiales bacterium]